MSTIDLIFKENKLDDLKRFLSHRKCLNTTNMYLIYIFHLFQTSGLLISTMSQGLNEPSLLWIGIALNFFASFIHVCEQTNNKLSNTMLDNINSIKEDKYIDETLIVEDKKSNSS